MNDDIGGSLHSLEQTIDSGAYIHEVALVREWGGADVIISGELTDRLSEWLGGSDVVISSQQTEPRRRVVITQFSAELSWLFYKLKDAFAPSLDFASKYDFYGRLAQAAIDHLEPNKMRGERVGLLKAVLAEAQKMAKPIDPKDVRLPFFAYGLFKPGQLCYSRIRDLVANTSDAEVAGILKERDGMPLLVPSTHSRVKGVLIEFKDRQEVEAYRRINEIEPGEVYGWKIIRLSDDKRANALLGKRPDRGSKDIEYVEEWDGRTDAFFKDGLEEVERILQENPELPSGEVKPLLRLQMAYALLWTALERYAGFRYHLKDKVIKKVGYIGDEPVFARSLKTHVPDCREVYQSTDLRKYTLNPNDPRQSIKYYYAVRSNVVHRGKAVINDFDIVQKSLRELLAIFKDMLNEAWGSGD